MSQWMNFGLGAANMIGQGIGWWGARQANEQRYQEAMELARQRFGGGMEGYGQGVGALMGGYGQLGQDLFKGPGGYEALRAGLGQTWQDRTRLLSPMYGERSRILGGEYSQRAAGLGGEYTKRTEAALGQLKGLGEQARKDLERQYGELGAQQRQQLRRSGMAGTTVQSAQAAGLQREKAGSFGRLEEQLRRERIGVESGLRGEELAARAGLTGQALGARGQLSGEYLGARGQLSAQQLAMQQQLGQMQLGAYGQFGGAMLGAGERMLQQGMQWGGGLSGDILNLMGSRSDIYPPTNPYLQQLGQYSYPMPWQ